MASKIFIDANVLLDFFLKRAGYNEAREIIELAINGEFSGYITPAIVHIAGYWLTKSYGAKKAKELLLHLIKDIEVIEISHHTTLLALHSKMDDIEDSLQYFAALYHKLDYFISADKKLQKESMEALPILTPIEFLKLHWG